MKPLQNRMSRRQAVQTGLLGIMAAAVLSPGALFSAEADIFAQTNLVAWCIVPFDARKRDSAQRAEMLDRLKLKRLAYDYRAEHVPTFDTEVATMKQHGIEVTAWWFPGTLNEEAKKILAVIEKYRITPQLWVTGGGAPTKNAEEQQQRVQAEAKRIRPIAEAAARLGCKVALYNHDNWFGNPDNQLAILKELDLPNVGIVYNFHHGHDDITRFPELWKRIQPHLLAVNLNGMLPKGEKGWKLILPIGEGTAELKMLQVIKDSGWSGPVGILDHRPETDSEETLRGNLDGLRKLVAQLK